MSFDLGPEGPWQRDIGPFVDAMQAVTQFAAQMHGMPATLVDTSAATLVVAEAVMMTGQQLTGYESSVLGGLSPEAAVIVAGLLLRTHMASSADRK